MERVSQNEVNRNEPNHSIYFHLFYSLRCKLHDTYSQSQLVSVSLDKPVMKSKLYFYFYPFFQFLFVGVVSGNFHGRLSPSSLLLPRPVVKAAEPGSHAHTRVTLLHQVLWFAHIHTKWPGSNIGLVCFPLCSEE